MVLAFVVTLRLEPIVPCTDRILPGHELLGLERRERLVRETDVVELTPDLHRAHVSVQVELVGHVGAVNDEVVGECKRL